MKRQDAVAIAYHSHRNTDAENNISHIQISGTLEEINAKTPDLRDYFAAKAMAAILANPQCMPLGGAYSSYNTDKAVAALAYQAADSMLEERKK